MKHQRYAVTLTGETPLLMHHDNLRWAENMETWRREPANKTDSKAGDDRTPAWRWIGNLYHSQDRERVVMYSDNLMSVIREGGAMCPTGKGQTTFMRQTQSGVIIDQAEWPLCVAGGREVPFKPILALYEKQEKDFAKHEALAISLGFELFVKRAKIGSAKHVRVRPRFDVWQMSGSLTVMDDSITLPVLENILRMAGTYKGLGDWRPSSPRKPGPFGRFTAEVKKI
jgi:hypothetical protein